MSWFQKLYESYDNCRKASESSGYNKILPIYHSMRDSHIEITIDGEGNFKEAKFKLEKETIIQTTEKSASRTSNDLPHGLADEIQYIAKDYAEGVAPVPVGGVAPPQPAPQQPPKSNKKFDEYSKLLKKWKESEYSNEKVNAIYEYTQKGSIVQDLIDSNIIYKAADKNLKLSGDKFDVKKLLIRWRVNIKNGLQYETWKDETIRESWINFMKSQKSEKKKGMCYIECKTSPLASVHPGNIYNAARASRGKIISSNDEDGFTYRGRFEESSEAVGISFEVSQKAHAVLKFLLSDKLNMAYKNGTQTYVAWAQSMKDIPKIWDDSYDLFDEGENKNNETQGNISQKFGEKLKNKMLGYSQNLGNSDNIMIIGLDSVTRGRISIIYYKELKSSDFLERIEIWHKRYSWLQYYYNKDKQFKQFYGVASPRDIAEVTYGNRFDNEKKIVKKTVDRILPLIIENKKIPIDIVENCVRQASNPIILEDKEQWKKVLRIACALYKGNKYGEDYEMGIDLKNADRNYLYGRLLAVIDYAEEKALKLVNENRETNARKYMNEFRNKPYLTWEKLHSMFNVGVRHRLKANRPNFLSKIDKELEEIHSKFISEKEFNDKSKLNGDYLLAYYCELDRLSIKHNRDNVEENKENN